jgi:RimJ/RimL family protein N-acetyltransferase
MSGAIDLVRDPLAWRTERFALRPLEDADAADVLRHLGDPKVVAFMDTPPLADLGEALAVVRWAQERRADDAGVRWSIRPRDGGVLIGTCGFNLVQREQGRRGEIAYDVGSAHWGRKVMDEIMPHLLTFGFEGLALRRIEALVADGNDPSRRLLERHGFAREGLLRDHGFWKGRYWDQLIYARLAAPPAVAPAPGARRSDGVEVRPLGLEDAPAVLALYRMAAAAPGGLARRPDEIDLDHVRAFLAKALRDGVTLGAWAPDGQLCAEIHAARPGPAQFEHVLSDLTVAVRPGLQGRGLGSRLFHDLFDAASRLKPRIERVELMVRAGHGDAVRLYERLGFRIEGCFAGRVKRPDGRLEDDLAMGRWL